jgi:hypothetical protein
MMDMLLIALMIVAALALCGWAYGYYAYYRPIAAAGGGETAAAMPTWVNLLGMIAFLAVMTIAVMWLGGWWRAP